MRRLLFNYIYYITFIFSVPKFAKIIVILRLQVFSDLEKYEGKKTQSGFDPASASSRMNHYEKGRHVPDIDTLRRMAAELNVPLNYFFCDDQTTAELALLISRMTEEERSNLIEALKTSSGVKYADKK